MSVTSVRELFDGRGGEFEGVTKNTALRRHRITTNNKNDDHNTIIAAGLLPTFLSTHPTNVFLRCLKQTINQEKGAYIWIAESHYETGVPQKIQQSEGILPLDRPAIVSGQSVQATRTPTKGYKFDDSFQPAEELTAIMNAAQDPFDSLPEIDDSRWVLSITKNYNPLPTWLFDMNNCTNDSDVDIYGRTCPRGTLKISGMRFAPYRQEMDQWFYEVSFEIHFRQGIDTDDPSNTHPSIDSSSQFGWALTLTNRGLNELEDGDASKKHEITLSRDRVATVPQLLNTDGSVISNAVAEDANYLSWMVYMESDFSELPEIPTPPI